MLEIWNLNAFSQATMTEWTTRLVDDKDWAHSAPFFKDKMAAIEAYKAASGNTTGSNRFVSANATTKMAGKLKSILQDMKNRQDNKIT